MVVGSSVGRTVAGRYRLEGVLGRGGMGVVWSARDTRLNRPVAEKEIRLPLALDEDERARWRRRVLREARAAARLNHPGVVGVYDVVEEDDQPFIVMELVDAPSLAEIVARDGPLPPGRVARLGVEIVDALAAAHARGIVHRDVKPGNVLLPAGGPARLTDFGIASIAGEAGATTTQRVIGSPLYMSPEQASNGASSPASDLWSLGATLYLAVEGRPPFDKGEAIPTLTAIVSDPPRPPARAGPLAPLLARLLVKDAGLRPDEGQVRRELEAVSHRPGRAVPDLETTRPVELPPVPVLAPAPGPVRATHRHRRRGAAGVVAVVVGTAAVVALAVLVASGSRHRGAPAAVAPSTTRLVPDATPSSVAPGAPTGAPSPPTPGAPPSVAPAVAGPLGAVPADWVRYSDPITGFTISHPPQWVVSTSGTLTDFRDPATGDYLRVDHRSPPDASAEADWRAYAPQFAAANPGYREIGIVPTTFDGYQAATWEYTYQGGGGLLHAVDLGFVVGSRYGFALNFQTRDADWAGSQAVFTAFQRSFQAPA